MSATATWKLAPVRSGRSVTHALASWAWRRGARMRRPGCIVVNYHRIGRPGDPFPHVGVKEFRWQVQWLSENCTVIGPEALRDPERRTSGARPPVLLTFDDGTRDYYELAYPVLKAFGLPAVVFPITDYIDHPRLPWWDRLYLAVRHAQVTSVSPPWRPDARVSLARFSKRTFLRECSRYLKSVPDETKDRAMDEIVLALGAPALPDVDRQFMTWDELRATMDVTTYGGHTHTHPLLSRIDTSRLQDEIRLCAARLTAETGIAPTLFAYPNGQRADFTPEAKALLRRYGFEVAFTTASGINDETTDRLEMRRLGMSDICSTLRLMAQLARVCTAFR